MTAKLPAVYNRSPHEVEGLRPLRALKILMHP